MNKESDFENQPLYDRFVTAEGVHVVPPPMTGNYMPFGPDIEIDYSQFTYDPKQSQTSESKTQTSDFDTCESNCSDETHESLPEPAVNEPKVVTQPKVWSDAPIIEEYESDSDDEYVSVHIKGPSRVKTPRENVKNQSTHKKRLKCLVLSPDFKLPDENQILLKVLRQNNMYSFNLENIVPLGGLACLIAKATTDESNLWHRRLGHVNFKNLNRLVKGNLVRGLPTKLFQNDHTCVACQKGKQHKASCKAYFIWICLDQHLSEA
ncbi:ribonuclease H-like domain-containing protein [Tanacetum coccineum]